MRQKLKMISFYTSPRLIEYLLNGFRGQLMPWLNVKKDVPVYKTSFILLVVIQDLLTKIIKNLKKKLHMELGEWI